MMFPAKNAFSVELRSCDLTRKAVMPVASINRPVSLIHTVVPAFDRTPLLSNKIEGKNNAMQPIADAMIEVMVKKSFRLIPRVLFEHKVDCSKTKTT